MSGQAYAVTATGNLAVQIVISAECKVTTGVGTNAMDFGTTGVIDADINKTGRVDVSCTNGTSYNVALGQGLYGTAVTDRKMKSGTTTVNYVLYRDSARQQNWGVTTSGAGADVYTGTGNGSSQQIPVYGSVKAPQTPPPGIYTDTVAITVNY